MKRTDIVTDIAFITAGSLILASGINFFLVPNEIAAGGVSGIATVLYLKLGVPLAASVVVLNGIIFAFGFKLLSRYELVKSLVGTASLSVFLEITKNIYAYSGDMLIAAVFGGVLSGTGIGLTVSRGASTGGSDMTGLMFAKKFKTVRASAVIFVFDAAVIAVSGFAFKNVTVMLYAVIAVYISAKATDALTVYGSAVKSVQIISAKYDEIAERIMHELKRGVTGIYAKGLYMNKESMMLVCAVGRREIGRLLRIVKELDRNAFVISYDVKRVLGEGFEKIEG